MRVVMEMKVVIIKLTTFCQFYCDHLSTTTMIMIKQPWINMTIWLQSMTLIINSWWRIAGAFYLVFIDFSQLALGFDIRHFLCTANVILKASFPVEIFQCTEILEQNFSAQEKVPGRKLGHLRSSQLRTRHFFSWRNPLKFTSSTQYSITKLL